MMSGRGDGMHPHIQVLANISFKGLHTLTEKNLGIIRKLVEDTNNESGKPPVEDKERLYESARTCIEKMRTEWRAIVFTDVLVKMNTLAVVATGNDQSSQLGKINQETAVQDLLSQYKKETVEICSAEELGRDATCAWLDEKIKECFQTIANGVSDVLLRIEVTKTKGWQDPAIWDGISMQFESIRLRMYTVCHLYKALANQINLSKHRKMVLGDGKSSVKTTIRHRTSGATASADSNHRAAGAAEKKDEEVPADRINGAGATAPPPPPPPPPQPQGKGSAPPPPPPPKGNSALTSPGGMPASLPPPPPVEEITFTCMLPATWNPAWDKKNGEEGRKKLIEVINSHVLAAMNNLYYVPEKNSGWQLMKDKKEPLSCIKPDQKTLTYLLESFGVWRTARWLHRCGIKQGILNSSDCPLLPPYYEQTGMHQYLKTNWLEDPATQKESEAPSSKYGTPKRPKGSQVSDLVEGSMKLAILPDYDSGLLVLKRALQSDFFKDKKYKATIDGQEYTFMDKSLFISDEKPGILDKVRASLKVADTDVIDTAFCMLQNEVLWAACKGCYPADLDQFSMQESLRGQSDEAKNHRAQFADAAKTAMGLTNDDTVTIFNYNWMNIKGDVYLTDRKANHSKAFIACNALDSLNFAFFQHLFENRTVLVKIKKVKGSNNDAGSVPSRSSHAEKENSRFLSRTDYLYNLRMNDNDLQQILVELSRGYMKDYSELDALWSLELYFLHMTASESIGGQNRIQAATSNLLEAGLAPYLENISECSTAATANAAKAALQVIRTKWNYIKKKTQKRISRLNKLSKESEECKAKILDDMTRLCTVYEADGEDERDAKESIRKMISDMQAGGDTSPSSSSLTYEKCKDAQKKLAPGSLKELWMALSRARVSVSLMFHSKLDRHLKKPIATWEKNKKKMFVMTRMKERLPTMYKLCSGTPGCKNEQGKSMVPYIQALVPEIEGMVDVDDLLHKLCGFYRLCHRMVSTEDDFQTKYRDEAISWNIPIAKDVFEKLPEEVCTQVARGVIGKARLQVATLDDQLCGIFHDDAMGTDLKETLKYQWKQLHTRIRPGTPEEQDADGAEERSFDDYLQHEFPKIVEEKVVSRSGTPRGSKNPTPAQSDDEGGEEGSASRKRRPKPTSSRLSCILEERHQLI